jgi:hypothetical protein
MMTTPDPNRIRAARKGNSPTMALPTLTVAQRDKALRKAQAGTVAW